MMGDCFSSSFQGTSTQPGSPFFTCTLILLWSRMSPFSSRSLKWTLCCDFFTNQRTDRAQLTPESPTNRKTYSQPLLNRKIEPRIPLRINLEKKKNILKIKLLCTRTYILDRSTNIYYTIYCKQLLYMYIY